MSDIAKFAAVTRSEPVKNQYEDQHAILMVWLQVGLPQCTLCEKEGRSTVMVSTHPPLGEKIVTTQEWRCEDHDSCDLCGLRLDRCCCDWGTWEDSTEYRKGMEQWAIYEECDYFRREGEMGHPGGACGNQID